MFKCRRMTPLITASIAVWRVRDERHMTVACLCLGLRNDLHIITLDVNKRNHDFSMLVKYLELLLEETNNDKMILEEQCDDAFDILQSWKMETKSKNSQMCTMNSENDHQETEDNSCEDIDEAITEHIDEMIEKARIVRKLAKEKVKARTTLPDKKIPKNPSIKSLSSDSNKCIPPNNKNHGDLISTSKSSKIDVLNFKESTPIPIKKSKSPKKKSPYSSSHYQTSYQKHFSSVTKNSVKMQSKTEIRDNTVPKSITASNLKNLKTATGSSEGSSQQISFSKINGAKKEFKPHTVENSPKLSTNFKIWNEVNEDTKEKYLEKAISSLQISSEVDYTLKLYHQYLKGIKSGNKEAAFKSQFIEQFEEMNSQSGNTNSKNDLLLREQIKKYLDIFRTNEHEDECLFQGNEPMSTSYSSVEKLKILEKKHLKLQKLKMQLNLNNIMLNELKSTNVDQSKVISVYKTLTALSDLTTLTVPIIIQKD